MNKNNYTPNQNQAFDKDSSAAVTREYINQLLKRIYNCHDIANDDAIALASLAASLDKFLISSETERRSALTLKNDLYQIVCNSDWERPNSNQNSENRSDTGIKFYTSDGQLIYLGSLLGSGGEGVVHKIQNMPGKVVKMFKPTPDRDYMERKIEALINNHIPSKLDNVLVYTIPESLLYDEADHFVGYIMPGITTRFKLFDVMRDSSTRKKYFPELDYRGLIIIAYNLAEAIYYLHEHDVVIGDLNHNNIVINPDGTVCLIDTDSYDIVDKNTNEHFPCVVGFAELLAPELQTVGHLKNGRFTKETDMFSFTILVFRLLMGNTDPFSGIRTNLVSRSISDIPANEAIVNGECPYIKTVEGMRIPEWAPSFDMLPEYIKNLFMRAFDYNKENYRDKIKERPTAREWMDALIRFYNEPLKQCEMDSFHWYRGELDECPFCSRAYSLMASKKQGIREKKGILESLANIITVEI